MSKYYIVEVENKNGYGVKERNLISFQTATGATDFLNNLAKEKGWHFKKDCTLFGGYYVDEEKNCYKVK